MIYNLIGRVTVRLAIVWLRRRLALRTALMAGSGVVAGTLLVTVAGYLLTRGDVPEA